MGDRYIDGELNSGLRDDREGWMGEGRRPRREGGYGYLQPILIVVQRKPATLKGDYPAVKNKTFAVRESQSLLIHGSPLRHLTHHCNTVMKTVVKISIPRTC